MFSTLVNYMEETTVEIYTEKLPKSNLGADTWAKRLESQHNTIAPSIITLKVAKGLNMLTTGTHNIFRRAHQMKH